MMNKSHIDNETRYLFGRSYDEELDFDKEDKIFERSQKLILDSGWEDVYSAWCDYLYTKCNTPESVINFAHLFWWYGGQDYVIPDPYKFLAYFYYKIDFDAKKYDEGDILDSLAITILPKAGFNDANLFYNTQYMPENDTKLIEEVNKYNLKDK